MNVSDKIFLNGELPTLLKDSESLIYLYNNQNVPEIIGKGVTKFFVPGYHIEKKMVEAWMEKMAKSNIPLPGYSMEGLIVIQREYGTEDRYGGAFFMKNNNPGHVARMSNIC